MFAKLEGVETRYEHIKRDLQEPTVINDQAKYRALMKDYSALEELVATYRIYKKTLLDIADSRELLQLESDDEMRAMAREELNSLEASRVELEQKLKILLLPKDPNDDKNIILEVRPAAGGDEAALFADELFRAYSHYCVRQGWRVEIMSYVPGNVGGAKEVIASVTGEKVFSKLKYESGVHRVQRVPKTETQGRIHTSTITVAVLPEADEIDVKIDPNDLRIDVFRSGGSGGQSVNTTDSAVRVTHLPSGIVVSCQDEKSQLKNKNKALKILYARLLAFEKEKHQKDLSDARLSQIGTGDRSERIRTYNFPQSRITDHRIGLTLHQLTQVMSGDLHLIVDPCIAHFQAEALKAQAVSL